jgi:uncharacterized protein (TIGR00369 family)
MNMIDRPPRERTLAWEDPKTLAMAERTMTGRAFLEAIRDGKLPPPPVAQLLDFTLAEVDEGRVVITMAPQEFHFNPIGTVHGGMIATLLDSVMGLAVHSKLPAGRGYTTLEIKVNYVRGVTVGTGPVWAIGRIVHLGRQTALVEADLTDASGKLLSQASSTCLVFDLPGR